MTNPLPPTDSAAGIADDQIEELIRLEAEATPGPWRTGHLCDDTASCNCAYIFGDDGRFGAVGEVYIHNGIDRVSEGSNDCPPLNEARANQKLIAAAKNAIKPLIARLKRAEAERDRLWKQLMMLIAHDNAELRVLQLESERDRLKEALRPFAEIVYTEDVCWLKDEYKLFAHGQFRYHLPGLTVGTLRAACDAYGETAAAALAPQETDQ